MKLRENYICPLELVHDMIRGKWKTIIIFQLRKGKCSFSDLHRGIEGITQKMLLEQLNELKQFELVNKKTFEGYPLRADCRQNGSRHHVCEPFFNPFPLFKF